MKGKKPFYIKTGEGMEKITIGGVEYTPEEAQERIQEALKKPKKPLKNRIFDKILSLGCLYLSYRVNHEIQRKMK